MRGITAEISSFKIFWLWLIFGVWICHKSFTWGTDANAATPDTFFLPDLLIKTYSNLIEYLKSHRVSRIYWQMFWGGSCWGDSWLESMKPQGALWCFCWPWKQIPWPVPTLDGFGRKTFNDFGASSLCCHEILGPLMAKTRDEVRWIPSGDGIMTHVQSTCVESFQLFILAFGWNLELVNLKTACFQTWSILEQDHA